ncbi:MAG TPA: hypothetical protein HPP66_04015 [Planctomycetes bacterium]|nr:hypothetical protein [Planctomycetota bacterium]
MGEVKYRPTDKIFVGLFFSDNGLLELNFLLLCFTGENIILFAGFGFESLVGSPDMLAAHYL